METLVSDECECAYREVNEIKSLIRAFEECTLPHREWTHQAHLIVAVWYLTQRSEADATMCIRRGILRYNAAKGIKTTRNSGYHETMTLFWIKLVGKYLSRRAGASIEELANGVIRSFGDNELPFAYYSRDLLLSLKARMRWVEPDLKAI